LYSAGVVLRDISDAELSLQCYAVWGKDCPKRLIGDFAFAVWDSKKSQLFCARDHVGARPIYYTLNDRFFAFASEDEALPTLPGVSSQPNEERVAYTLVQTFDDFDYAHSWLEDVWSLTPAQYMTISIDGTVKKSTYWKLEAGEEASYASDEECQEAFLNVFGEAVRCRMRSKDDISAMMSGGLDSASILAMVKRITQGMVDKQFHTFSTISDDPNTCIESQCILSLTRDLGNNAHYVSVPSFTGMLDLQDLIKTGWSNPHPVDSSILLPAMMCLAASRHGHRVMLHGVSGDLTMHVPHRYIAWWFKTSTWKHAWHECQAASRNNTYLQGVPPLLLLLQNIWVAYSPRGIKRLVRRLRDMKAPSLLSGSLINRDFAKNLRLVERMRAKEKKVQPTLSDIQLDHIRVLSPPHGIASSLSGYDRVAGRYGIELRDPWGDRRVMEFFLRLPLKYKVKDGWTKYLVRATFGKELAPEIRWRLGKEHLGWNYYFRLIDECKDFVSRTLEYGLATGATYVDVKSVREQYVKYCNAKEDAERESIFDVVILALWVK
jgi:asparagine synthase (glutamine-hydrolysing)